jgi:hypothetical protein
MASGDDSPVTGKEPTMMAFDRHRSSILLLASALLGMAVLVAPAAEATVIQVINEDSPGEGFNDPKPVAPVGGNTGTTLGQQRLIAFQHAANIWAGLVSSAVTIRVGATFDPLPCNATGAVLGAAGPTTAFRDFAGALRPNTWYPGALASALSGSDLDAGDDDISATFNSAIGTTCAFPQVWYYGLDGNPPGSQIDFVSVLVHELCHGLGFLTFIDVQSGAKLLGFDDTFMLNLERHGASPPDFPSMTDAQRAAASTDTGNLHWVGANVGAASGVLTAGKVGTHVQMFAPNPSQEGSSVSHWDTTLAPNQVMEPIYTGPLHDPVLELPLFQDIGWTLLGPPSPPTPSSTNLLPGFPADYDGDGAADIVVYRPSTGTWFILQSSDGSVRTVQWGIGGDVPVPADYDGDRKADITVYRPSTGTWFILQSSDGSLRTVQWGVGGDVPIPGDYDGDGTTDIAVYRPSTGTWFILQSSNGSVRTVQWGVGGDRPVPGDYDGDRKIDIAVYRPSNGTWYIINSATPGARQVQWGIGGDVPVPGDYDRDGATDIAVYRASNGTWYIVNSATPGARQVQWGIGGDVPVPGDYDRDRAANIAVYRPSNGTWYIINSATPGVRQVQWGIGGDQPPPEWF